MALGEQLGEKRCGRDEVLEVIEYQEQLALP
jgi:hypothetical protein